MTYPRFLLLAGASALLGLGACATDGKTDLKPAAAARTPPREQVNQAIALLFEGKAAEARALLVRALKEQPDNAMAIKLLAQVDTDPRTLLGTRAFSYVAQDDDTASSLAARYLGDPLMFYALARYNQIDPPSQPLAGRTVMIPGEPKAAPPPAQRPQAPPDRPAAKSAPAPTPAAGRNPARARALRSSALVQMNAGAIDRAVSLLQQALSFDPDSLAIQRDLDRALRIQHTVRTR